LNLKWRPAAHAASVAARGALTTLLGCIPDPPLDSPSSPPPSEAGAAGPVAGYCGDGFIDPVAGEQCDPGTIPGEGGIAGCSSDCQVECPGGLVWNRNNHCYQMAGTAFALQTDTFGFPSAAGLCQSEGSHVVTFASQDELEAVVGQFDAGTFWVGLQTGSAGYDSVVPYEPGWSATCPGCFAVTSDAGLAPYSDPLADGGTANCVAAPGDPTQPWQQYPCSMTPRFRSAPVQVICEFEPVGRRSTPCEAGTCIDVVATYLTKRYVFVENSLSADDAASSCATLGGTLVVLETPEEREQLWLELSRLTAVSPGAIWIGMSEVEGAGGQSPWQWDDGESELAYPSPWGDMQPARGRPFGSPRNPGGSFTTRRAFLWHQSGEDDTLAHNDYPFAALPYVCELAVDTVAEAQSAPGEAGAN
jgi:hypothetical protein